MQITSYWAESELLDVMFTSICRPWAFIMGGRLFGPLFISKNDDFPNKRPGG